MVLKPASAGINLFEIFPLSKMLLFLGGGGQGQSSSHRINLVPIRSHPGDRLHPSQQKIGSLSRPHTIHVFIDIFFYLYTIYIIIYLPTFGRIVLRQHVGGK